MASTGIQQQSGRFIKLLRRLIPFRAFVPRVGELIEFSGKSLFLVVTAVVLGLIVLWLQSSTGLALEDLINHAAQAHAVQDMNRGLILFWVVNYALITVLQRTMSCLIDIAIANTIARLDAYVQSCILGTRLEKLPRWNMETLWTSQVSNIDDGLWKGQKVLLVNVGTLVSSTLIIVNGLSSTQGAELLFCLLVAWIGLEQTLGYRHYLSVRAVKSLSSTYDRLKRHLVRQRGLYFLTRHIHVPLLNFVARSREAKRRAGIKEATLSASFEVAAVILLSGIVLSILLLGGSVQLGSVALVLIVGERLLNALEQIASARNESQAIEAAFERLYGELFERYRNNKLQSLEGKDLEGLLRSPSFSVTASDLSCVDLTHPREPQVLERVSFTIVGGEIVVFYGEAREGKTPLIDLITGASLPRLKNGRGRGGGELLINGYRSSDLRFSDIGRITGLITTQHLTLFEELGGPLALVYHGADLRKRSPSSSKVMPEMLRWVWNFERLSRELGVQEAIERLPHGLDTEMIEVMPLLSKEEQWCIIGLMRTLLPFEQWPRMLIIDEQLDDLRYETIRLVARLLNKLAGLGVLTIITSARDPQRLVDCGLNVSQRIDLAKFKPTAPQVQQQHSILPLPPPPSAAPTAPASKPPAHRRLRLFSQRSTKAATIGPQTSSLPPLPPPPANTIP